MLVLVAAPMSACTNQDGALPTGDAALDAAPTQDAGGDAQALDAGADGGPTVDAGPQLRDYTIRFRAMVRDSVASCAGTYAGFGPSADETVRFKDLRFYVHAIELVTADGHSEPLAIADAAPWQRAGVALLDFEDATHACGNGTFELRDAVVGSALEGNYTSIRFVLGVPFALNHLDRSTASAPLSLSALFWSWQGGYKFLRADVETIPSGADAGLPSTFNVHVGSTGCDGDIATGGTTSCTGPNRPTIELNLFNPETSVVEFDFAAVVGALDINFNTPTTPPGCMSTPTDPECAEVLPSLGIDFGATPAAMDAFRVGTMTP